MAGLNHVILLGRIAAPPELKEGRRNGNSEGGENGNWKLCRLVVAVTRDFKTKETDFFDVTVWNKTAENCAKFLEKGRTVLIEGFLQKQKWEQEGKTQYKTAIIAKNVQFLPGGSKKESE